MERFLSVDELKRLAVALDREVEEHRTIYPVAAIRCSRLQVADAARTSG
jgi:hypothetical protein